jgi:hypothetical protein
VRAFIEGPEVEVQRDAEVVGEVFVLDEGQSHVSGTGLDPKPMHLVI